ncbi:MAG: cbb3-type cytochrome c oxidase subunit I [Saprospiraceae bacterium]|nr:cbb3-type cytochrome c oxidase subunit I [Saprospiraceae bacterium]
MADINIIEEQLHGHDHHDDGHDHHDDHHGDKYQSSLVDSYLFSMDHKNIAKQFLITGMFWAVIGSAMSILFRLQLGFPDADLSWLQPLLGGWIEINEQGQGVLAQDFYYALVTMHGTIIVFFVLTAGLSGTFSNLLIPLQIGARDMASPLMNMLSYWFFFLAGVVLFISLFLNTGPFSGGWTAYPPLSELPQASDGSKAGATMWLLSLVFFVVSVLLGGINYITTVLNMRTKGMSLFRMPLTIWAFLVTAILGLLSFPVIASGFFMVLFDRSLGTSFFLNEIFVAGEALTDRVGGSSLLYQHLFWFLGHPEVYIIILPAMGIVSEVLSVHSRKPIFGYKAMVFSILAIGVLSFLVWAHHMYMSGVNPFISNIFVLFTLIIAVPSAVKVFNWIATIWGGNLRFNSASLFSIGFVSMFISGGLTGIFLGNSVVDIQQHDTYFVVAHFHVVMGVAAFFGMFAGVYHWFPRMFGRFMNETLGKIHFWGTMISAYLVFGPMHYLGMAGVPRRYYSFEYFENFSQFDAMNAFITIAAILGFLFQVVFIVNFFYSIYRGRKQTDMNPWGATTLEWTAPINAGHGNWPGEIPEVHRWPYDLSRYEDEEFVMQTVPLKEGEVDGGH